MSTTLTIRLDEELDQILTQLANEQKRTKSELVREMLRRQAAVADLHLLRAELLPQAEGAGYLSDDDVFRDVS